MNFSKKLLATVLVMAGLYQAVDAYMPSQWEAAHANEVFFSAVRAGNVNKVVDLISYWSNLVTDVEEVSVSMTPTPVSKEVGNTGLHVATQKSNPGMVKLLIDKGSNVNTRNTKLGKPHDTPLHIAAKQLNPTIVRMLVQAQASPNVKRAEDGNTPLHVAAMQNPTGETGKQNQRAVIQALAAFGALNTPNAAGKRPSDLATNAELAEIIKVTTKTI